jgi:hypothetical protein
MHLRRRSMTLPTCSICLRVRQRGSWIAAETVIAEQRSFERASLPSLQPALCDGCEQSIYERRLSRAA